MGDEAIEAMRRRWYYGAVNLPLSECICNQVAEDGIFYLLWWIARARQMHYAADTPGWLYEVLLLRTLLHTAYRYSILRTLTSPPTIPHIGLNHALI